MGAVDTEKDGDGWGEEMQGDKMPRAWAGDSNPL